MTLRTASLPAPRPPGAAAVALLVLALAGASVGADESPAPAPAAAVLSSERAAELADPERRALALKRVSQHLICQCSCNMVLSECNHQSCPFALPERKRILAMLDAGKTDDEIVAHYVKEYGRGILSTPPDDGSIVDRLAWIMPWLALVAGTLVAARLVVVFTRRTRAAEAAPGPPVSDDELRRVEREIGPSGGAAR